MKKVYVTGLAALGVVGVAGTARAQMQDEIPVNDSVRKAHTVQVSPHNVVFTPGSRTATLTFTNPGSTPAEADVMLQLAYPYWQTSDTVLFATDAATKRRARDTVVANPKPSDRYAGEWLSGVPTHLSLKPGESRQVTLTLNAPASVPDGEYRARITTVVRNNKNKPPKGKDAKQTFKMPIEGNKIPDLRDSAEVFFRKGEMSTGLKILMAHGAIDDQDRPTPRPDFGSHQLWMIVHVQPMGTAHFDGQLRAVAKGEDGSTYPYDPAYHFSMYQEGIMRFWAKTEHLPPGKYVMTLNFEGSPEGPQGDAKIPVEHTSVDLPFEVK